MKYLKKRIGLIIQLILEQYNVVNTLVKDELGKTSHLTTTTRVCKLVGRRTVRTRTPMTD